jgi:hypothetical protein
MVRIDIPAAFVAGMFFLNLGKTRLKPAAQASDLSKPTA